MATEPNLIRYKFEAGSSQRARISVYGRTPEEAFAAALKVKSDLSDRLPKDSICWRPNYMGFARDENQHVAEVIVVLGLDREASRACIQAYVVESSSSK